MIPALARVQEVVQTHFENEEAMMKDNDYPYYAAHKEQHRQLNRDVYAARKLYGVDPNSIDFEIFLTFLRAWCHQHILRSDAIFVSHLTGAMRPAHMAPAVDPIPECLESVLADGEDGLQAVPVQVPRNDLDTIYTCARLLRRGGPEAEAIRTIADPLQTMSLDEAAIVAKALMR